VQQQQQQQQRSVARARVVAGDLNFASIPVCIIDSSIAGFAPAAALVHRGRESESRA
jgi:hypothetical protein